MKFLSLLGAIGAGIFAATWLASLQRRGSIAAPVGGLNINQASRQEIMNVLGLDADTADRIIEHRPYPTRLDLLGRMVLPDEIYRSIKDRIVYKAS
jgi:DNA uptake protein ComE-like DNA-binding protein